MGNEVTMDNFWIAVKQSKLTYGKAQASGLGVLCLTIIVIVALLA